MYQQSLRRAAYVLLLALAVGAPPLLAQAAENQGDNGTDPTKLNRTLIVSLDQIELAGGDSTAAFKLSYQHPLRASKPTSLRLQVPVSRLDAPGSAGATGLGDVSLRLSRVMKITRSFGTVLQGELYFDTATKQQLGAGQTFFKGTFVYARFLSNRAIFAPAIVHALTLEGADDHGELNNTTVDFYFVPKFPNPKFLMTLDPAVSFDWENGREFVSLAVTVGRLMGPAFGGNSQLYVKPLVSSGGERISNWGLEVGYKVIGF